jgi:hypothetical protein
MVAAQAKRGGVLPDHMRDGGLDLPRHPVRLAVIEVDIAPVDHAHLLERVEGRGPHMAPGQLRRGGADAARAEPAAGAVRDRGVERHPDHRQIDPRQIAGKAAAAEAQRAGIHLLVMGHGAVAGGEEGIVFTERVGHIGLTGRV